MKQVKFGPRFVIPTYTVKVVGEHGCMMTGSPETAANQVACYLESRPAGAVDVFYSEDCGHCRGHGRIAGKRRMSFTVCKVCKGEPTVLPETRIETHYGSAVG